MVVTLAAALLTWGVGGTSGTVTAVTLAVLAGQLSIGWSNDAIDADRDRAARRADKPAATGALHQRTLWIAATGALLVAVGLSLGLGVRAGLTHIGLVAMGWAYNIGLKSTILSPLPYALAFGALPSVATLTAAGHWAPLWLTSAGAAVGVAAHFANVIPDLADDEATGVRGLPHRLGERGSRLTAAAVLGLAVLVVVTGAHLAPLVVVAIVTAAAIGVLLLVLGRSSVALPSIMALVLVILATVGGRLAG